MRWLRSFLVMAACAACFATTSAPAEADSFVGRSGTQLTLDGQSYRFTGINIYNANNGGLCWYPMVSGSTLDDSLAELGGAAKVIRAWFFQSLATAGGQRDWSGFDHTLAVAAARGVKVIATLGNQWEHCDGLDGGGGSYKDEAWYTTGYTQPDPAGTESYRDWVAEVAERYKGNPTILAWQLMNEAEVKPYGGSGDCSVGASGILKNFATDVSALVKSVDPNHLVSLGTIGGGQCGAQGDEYQDVHDIPSIDVCEYHDYGSPTVAIPGDQWNGLQRRLDQCNALGKPLFVGETGIRPIDVGGTLLARADAFQAKFVAQLGAGVVGELVWAWNKDGSSLTDYDIGPGDPALGTLAAWNGPARVTVTDLGTLGDEVGESQAYAINASGQVVGQSTTAANVIGAFSWTQSGGMVDLGSFGGGVTSASAVSSTGQVVGYSQTNTETHAFSWTESGGLLDLGTLGGTQSYALRVNGSGQVVGYSSTLGDAETHAFAWSESSGMLDLGTLGGTQSVASYVNGSGQVVGYSSTPGDAETHAFIWTQASGIVDLGTLPGSTYSQAYMINDVGQVTGASIVGGALRAFLWTESAGMVDLGTLGGTFAAALAINVNGQVVGYSSLPGDSESHAFSWTASGGMVDLGNLGGNPGSQFVSSASAVNASGQVVGNATTTAGQQHAFSWTQAGGMVDLGTLNGNPDSEATAINDSGQIVGHSRHATLWRVEYALSVSKSGTGEGTVSSSPAGIDCGSSCQASFNSGTAVTLTAAPNGTSTFSGWSGDCTGTADCTLTMDAARSVTATFTNPGDGRSASDRADDVSGPQVHVVYAIPSDGVDRLLDVDGTLAGSVSVFGDWLAGQTGGRSLRLDTFGGELDITFFRMSQTDAEVASATGAAFVRDAIEDELVAAGFDDPDKLYAVYYDGSSTFSCGGGAWPPTLPGTVAAMYLLGVPPGGGPPCNSNVFAPAGGVPGYLEYGMLHEIVHTLGFVPECAPNHTLAGHVSLPANDLMYAGAEPWDLSNVVLDDGNDDYYGHDVSGCLDLEDSPYLTGSPPPPDTTDPVATIMAPADGGLYELGEQVTLDFSCTDEPGGSGITVCEGPNGEQPGDPVAVGPVGDQSFTVTAQDAAGNASTWSVSYTVFAQINESSAAVVAPGGFATTDGEGNGATLGDLVETTVTSPTGGFVAIAERPFTGIPPAGYSILGERVTITAPPGTPASPLVLTFMLDGSIVPLGQNEATISLFRNSVPVPNCLGQTQAIPNNPCISGRARVGDDVVLTVLTSQASDWDFAITTPPPNPCAGAPPAGAIVGTNGNNTLKGTSGNDVIFGLGGNDTIDGKGGNDTICAGDGADTVSGGDGNDRIDTGTGNDKADGNAGTDTIDGQAGNDNLTGGAGDDTLNGGDGNDRVDGNDGTDTLSGANNDDVISGGGGNDRIDTGAGIDKAEGNAGNDTIDGLAGNDNLTGGAGDDTLNGGDGNDHLEGNDGTDTLRGGNNDDDLKGGAGNDNLDGGPGTDKLNGETGTDTCTTGETKKSCEA